MKKKKFKKSKNYCGDDLFTQDHFDFSGYQFLGQRFMNFFSKIIQKFKKNPSSEIKEEKVFKPEIYFGSELIGTASLLKEGFGTHVFSWPKDLAISKEFYKMVPNGTLTDVKLFRSKNLFSIWRGGDVQPRKQIDLLRLEFNGKVWEDVSFTEMNFSKNEGDFIVIPSVEFKARELK